MARAQFANNAHTTLAANITGAATTLTVATGKGTLFPVVASYFYCTLSEGSLTEIVKVTARSGDVFTVVRAQEGTTAQAFSVAAKVSLNLTAAALAEFAVTADLPVPYIHPTQHAPSVIKQDPDNRFVSDAEKAAWGNKASLDGATFTGPVVGITAAMVGAPAGSGTSTGTNTGDETAATIRSKLGITTLSGTNTGDQIIPTTLPASDVYAWAKAATKPSYTKAEVGLSNVDNTSDADKPVSAATAAAIQALTDSPIRMNSRLVTANLAIPSAYNAGSVGPIQISDGVTVTVQDNATWAVA